jgi:hypothetical protein
MKLHPGEGKQVQACSPSYRSALLITAHDCRAPGQSSSPDLTAARPGMEAPTPALPEQRHRALATQRLAGEG